MSLIHPEHVPLTDALLKLPVLTKIHTRHKLKLS